MGSYKRRVCFNLVCKAEQKGWLQSSSLQTQSGLRPNFLIMQKTLPDNPSGVKEDRESTFWDRFSVWLCEVVTVLVD